MLAAHEDAGRFGDDPVAPPDEIHRLDQVLSGRDRRGGARAAVAARISLNGRQGREVELPRTTPPTSISADTSRDAHEAQMDAYRRMGGPGRVAVMFRLSESARRWSMAGIRRRHPGYDDVQVRLALARLTLGDDLVLRVWPDFDLVDP